MSIELSELVVPITMQKLAGVASVVGGIGAITAAISGTISSTAEWAGGIDELSTKTGLSADEAAAFSIIAQETGISVENAATSIGFMNKSLVDSEGNLGKTGQALADLGVDVYDANGNLKSTAEITEEAAIAIMSIEDPAARARAEMEVFGKQGTNLDDTLGALATGGLAEATQKAADFGLLVGGEGVAKAEEFQKQTADLKLMMQGLALAVGGPLMGALNTLIPAISDLISGSFEWMANHKEVLVGFFTALGLGIIYLAVTALPPWIAGLWAQVPALWASLAPMLPIIAAILLISAVVALLYKAWTDDWGGIRTKLTEVWEGKLKPIFDMIATWLKVNIPEAVATLKAKWDELKTKTTEIFDAIKTFISEKVDVVKAFFTETLPTAIQTLKDKWDELKTKVEEVWSAIIEGVTTKVEEVKTAISNIFEGAGGLWTKFTTWISDMKDNGAALLQGMIDGIASKLGAIIAAITGACQSIIDTVLKLLGIASPSKVFRGVGENLMEGLALGISENASLANMALDDINTNLTSSFDMSPSLNKSTYSGDKNSPTIDYDKLGSVLARSLRTELQRMG